MTDSLAKLDSELQLIKESIQAEDLNIERAFTADNQEVLQYSRTNKLQLRRRKRELIKSRHEELSNLPDKGWQISQANKVSCKTVMKSSCA